MTLTRHGHPNVGVLLASAQHRVLNGRSSNDWRVDTGRYLKHGGLPRQLITFSGETDGASRILKRTYQTGEILAFRSCGPLCVEVIDKRIFVIFMLIINTGSVVDLT